MSKHASPPGQRQLRVGEELRHALAHILERDEVRDPALSGRPITVTEVRISPDLRQATVFVVPLGGGRENEVLAALARARGFLRRRIADSVRLRYVPDLTFRIDQSFDEAERIARALRDPAVARDLGADEAQAAQPSGEDKEAQAGD